MLLKVVVKQICKALLLYTYNLEKNERRNEVKLLQVTLLVPLAIALPQPQGGKTAKVGTGKGRHRDRHAAAIVSP